ncbi:MAG: DUF1553 domain-containing protein [Planctomycetaceae bacterium]
MLRSLLLTIAAVNWISVAAADDIDFNRDIRPILSNKCFACHGPDKAKLQAGLRLDKAEIATSELDSGCVAVVPGKPGDSELVYRITSDDDSIRMPPAEFGKPLTEKEIATLREWIEQGAKFAAHWSYVRPQRREPPAPAGEFASWPKNPLDNFALQRMQQHGLKPSPEADRYALARRVSLDLTGLPPTIEEVDAFVASDDPQAYEKFVDDLLKRPAFGEHWARKWLDLARYADSAGYADDPARTIWAYRDWVIRAINDNMPFDQFTVEQLAGDLLPNATEDQLIATAFHRNTMTNSEGGTNDEEFRNVAIVDRVNTTMAVWMGTTMACAQCHSHKYDPITQEEYFRFFAILNNTQDADRRDEAPLLELYTDEQKLRKRELQADIERMQKEMSNSTPELVASQQNWEQQLRTSPTWTARKPASVSRLSGQASQVLDDRSVLIADAAKTDTYTVDVPVAESFAAIRLETVPHESLPDMGSGFGGGNFVITGVRAQLIPDGNSPPTARFVRITNLGKQQILSLAEVEVFSAGKNVAGEGKATQHSTAFNGPAERAIDGNTDGDYQKNSVTHTETVDNPWWELDLGRDVSIERIAVWNRTDNNLQSRLSNFTIELLDADRKPVTQQTIAEPPNPSAEYSSANVRNLTLSQAFADYHQPGFEPADVLSGKTGNDDGWAVGGSTKNTHQLVLVADNRVEVEQPATLRISIEQNSPHVNHLLGHFRIDTTRDDAAIQRSKLPQPLLAILDTAADQRSQEQSDQLAAHYRQHIAAELASQRQQLAQAHAELAALKPATSVPVLREVTDQRRETHLQYRGNYLDQGSVVKEGVPVVFNPPPENRPMDRLALAEWLTDEANPLTARVLANRYWETLFGRGIVLTSEEFGSQGELSTHPELLDWLAVELMESGWNSKALIRTIVTSATYRQSAKVTAEAAAADPDDRWLARGPRIRLSAEMVRDQALAVSGLLSDRMYGPPVKPPQPNLGLSAAFGSSTDWQTSEGTDRYRRGLYTTWRRSNPYPSMATFDAPNREVCTVRRNRTNTPLQSLVTLNDPAYVEAAQSLARLALQHSTVRSEQITHAFRRCLLRHPTDAEVASLVALFEDTKARLSQTPEDAAKLATDPLGPVPAGLDPLDAATMTVVGNVLLNLDEMFLKR